MKLKKINAALSLLTTLTLFVHIGFTTYAFLTFFYNETLKNIFSYPFMVFTCLHAILGMCIVLFFNDGSKLADYPKQNVETIVQRITGFLMLPLLILHLNTFKLLQSCAADGKWFLFGLLIFSQVVFYVDVFAHTAVSFSRAFITLGKLSSIETKKKIDIVVYIVCAVCCAFVLFVTIKTELAMFLPAQG